MKRLICRCLIFFMVTAFLFNCGLICVQTNAETDSYEQTTTTMPLDYEIDEFLSWVESEKDLRALLETERKIDGAYAEGYAGRLREFYEQDRKMFISTLAECSADARNRAALLLPGGYFGLQEMQSFHDDILLLMKDGTWTEQEMEVLREIEGSAKQLLDMYLPEPTTEPPATDLAVPEITAADTTEETTVPVQSPKNEINTTVIWVVVLSIAVAATAFGIGKVIKSKRH